jgi:hypothetical protein
MTEQELRQLLREADQAADPPPAMPPDLIDQVRQTARQRRRTRMAAQWATAAVVALAVGAILLTRAGQGPNDKPTGETIAAGRETEEEEIARLRAEIAQLRQEAERRMQTVRLLEAELRHQKSLAELRRIQSGPDPLRLLDEQIERAAFTIIFQADRMYNELGLPESAVEDYRRIIELFGQTRSAEHARKRLNEIQKKSGGVS